MTSSDTRATGAIDDYGHRGKRRVTVDREVFEELTRQADAFRDLAGELGSADAVLGLLIEAPGVRDLLMDEYAAWTARKDAADSAGAVAGQLAGRTIGASWAELQRRRQAHGELAEQFQRRHGGEYRGGPVDWATGRPANTAERAA